MAARVRIEINRVGVRAAALTSPEVRSAVSQIAERIASVARSKTEDEIVVAHAGRSRARSYVRILGDESENRPLGSSIDAGRLG